MRVNVCVPTRGKPDYLVEYLSKSLANSVLSDTRFVIGFDEDDSTAIEAMNRLPRSEKIICSIEPREDSLGAKYNRCAAIYDADLYVMAVDDTAVVTPGWDELAACAARTFTDGIGCVYLGYDPGEPGLPACQAITRGFMDIIGYLCVPHYPYWWGNTALDEVAQMCGRIHWVNIELTSPKKWPATHKRDLAFWAWVFDTTRPLRAYAATQIMMKTNDPPWRKRSLVEVRAELLKGFEFRNSKLRDPANGKALMGFVGNDDPIIDFIKDPNPNDPESERHARLREAALKLIGTIGG